MAANDYRDFYLKYPEHPKYNDRLLQTESETEMVVNKIEMILSTNKGDFIGDPDFGANLSHYLWSTRTSADRIRQLVQSQVNKYCPELNSTDYSLKVSIMEGELRDILLVDFVINDQQIRAVLQ